MDKVTSRLTWGRRVLFLQGDEIFCGTIKSIHNRKDEKVSVDIIDEDGEIYNIINDKIIFTRYPQVRRYLETMEQRDIEKVKSVYVHRNSLAKSFLEGENLENHSFCYSINLWMSSAINWILRK